MANSGVKQLFNCRIIERRQIVKPDERSLFTASLQ
jgi:hypothetical protein